MSERDLENLRAKCAKLELTANCLKDQLDVALVALRQAACCSDTETTRKEARSALAYIDRVQQYLDEVTR